MFLWYTYESLWGRKLWLSGSKTGLLIYLRDYKTAHVLGHSRVEISTALMLRCRYTEQVVVIGRIGPCHVRDRGCGLQLGFAGRPPQLFVLFPIRQHKLFFDVQTGLLW